MLTKAALTAETLAAVLAQGPDCVILLDPGGRVVWINALGMEAMEIDGGLEQVAGVQWTDRCTCQCRSRTVEAMAQAREGVPARFREQCETFKGNQRWWDSTLSAVRDRSGDHIGFLMIARDVTQHERDREAMATMVAEMRHRLRNSYALVCSLMSGHARDDESRSTFAREMSDRVMALAAAQSLFEDGQEHGELEALVRALAEPFASGLVEDFSIEVDPGIAIGRRTADAIALVLGELGVNAVKYGAAGRRGSLRISARVEGGQIMIDWLECHDGREPAPGHVGSSSGQGLSIIRRIVNSRQGSFVAEFHESGFSARLVLPLIGPAGLSAQD